MDILERILKLRKAKGWSEYKLSVETGIPQSTISSWFRKNAQPSISSLQSICDASGITLAQFFSDGITLYPTEMQNRLLDAFSHFNNDQQKSLVDFLEKFEQDND